MARGQAATGELLSTSREGESTHLERLRELADRGPTGTAARTAIVGTLGFAIGVWVVDDLQFAVFAAFTGIALSGFADYGGSLRGRTVANVVTGGAAAVLVCLGTLVSESVILGPIAALLLTFIVVIAGGLGGYARAGSRVLVIFLVLAIGIPAPVGALAERIGGVALGTALVSVAAVLLWPQRPRREIEAALADAARAIAEGIAAVASGSADSDQTVARADAAVKAARRKAAKLGATPAGPVARDRSRAYLLDDLERATLLMSEVGAPPEPGDDPVLAEIVDVGRTRLADARRAFLEVADAMSGVPAPRSEDVQAALGRTERELASLGAAPVDSARIVVASEWALLLNELAWTAGVAETHATGRQVPIGRGDRDGEGFCGTEPRVAIARRAIGVIRADLSIHSVRFQDSVRLAAALGVAVGLTAALDLSHGFWVSLATLTVLKTAARSTAISAFDAIVGTLVGFGLSVLIVLAAGVEHPTYLIALPILIFLSIWASGAIGLAAGQAAFTMLVVVLFNLLEPGGWELGIARVEDVVVGAAAGIAIGFVAWPRGSRAELAHATGELVGVAARYARGVMSDLLAGRDRRRVDLPERLEVKAASQRLDEVLQLSLAEGRPSRERMAHWIAIAGETHRLWYIADHHSLAPVASVPACEPLQRHLEGAVDEVTSLYEAAGESIAAGELPTTGAVIDRDQVNVLMQECLSRSSSPETITALARLLLISRWVGVTSAALADLRTEIAAATADGPPELHPHPVAAPAP